MSTFEFLFALFGLLLGFSIAEIAGGFARAYDRRKIHPIGWIAPGLAAVLVVDILAFWYDAWNQRDLDLKFWVIVVAAAIGLIYYFAAAQLFPREGSSLSPTEHVMARRKEIAGAVFVANLLMYVPTYVEKMLAEGAPPAGAWVSLVYWVLLAVIAFARPAWIIGAAICAVLGITLVLPLAVVY